MKLSTKLATIIISFALGTTAKGTDKPLTLEESAANYSIAGAIEFVKEGAKAVGGVAKSAGIKLAEELKNIGSKLKSLTQGTKAVDAVSEAAKDANNAMKFLSAADQGRDAAKIAAAAGDAIGAEKRLLEVQEAEDMMAQVFQAATKAGRPFSEDLLQVANKFAAAKAEAIYLTELAPVAKASKEAAEVATKSAQEITLASQVALKALNAEDASALVMRAEDALETANKALADAQAALKTGSGAQKTDALDPVINGLKAAVAEAEKAKTIATESSEATKTAIATKKALEASEAAAKASLEALPNVGDIVKAAKAAAESMDVTEASAAFARAEKNLVEAQKALAEAERTLPEVAGVGNQVILDLRKAVAEAETTKSIASDALKAAEIGRGVDLHFLFGSSLGRANRKLKQIEGTTEGMTAEAFSSANAMSYYNRLGNAKNRLFRAEKSAEDARATFAKASKELEQLGEIGKAVSQKILTQVENMESGIKNATKKIEEIDGLWKKAAQDMLPKTGIDFKKALTDVIENAKLKKLPGDRNSILRPVYQLQEQRETALEIRKVLGMTEDAANDDKVGLIMRYFDLPSGKWGYGDDLISVPPSISIQR